MSFGQIFFSTSGGLLSFFFTDSSYTWSGCLKEHHNLYVAWRHYVKIYTVFSHYFPGLNLYFCSWMYKMKVSFVVPAARTGPLQPLSVAPVAILGDSRRSLKTTETNEHLNFNITSSWVPQGVILTLVMFTFPRNLTLFLTIGYNTCKTRDIFFRGSTFLFFFSEFYKSQFKQKRI